MRESLSDEAVDLQQAVELLRSGQWEAASALLKDVISRDPTIPVAYAALGVAQVRLGQVDRAVETMDRAHYLSPADPLILYQYGLALKAAGRSAAAQQRFSASEFFRARGEIGSPELIPLSAWLPPSAPTAPATPASRPLEATSHGSSSPRTERLRPRSPQSAQPGSAPAFQPTPPPPPTPVPIPVTEPAPLVELPDGPLASLHRTSETLRAPGQDGGGWTYTPPPERSLPEQYQPNTLDRFPVGRRAKVKYDPDPAADSQMDPEPPPGFLGMIGATLQLWLGQPLPWLIVLAIGNAAAVLLTPSMGGARWANSLLWSLVLAVTAAPAFLILSDQWVFGRMLPTLGPTTLVRLLRALLLSVSYLLITLTPLLILLSLRSVVPLYLLLPGALTLTLPIHALFSPALMLAATEGPGGIAALRVSVMLSGRRTWLHLAVMLVTALVIGGALGGLVWALTRLLVGVGDAVLQMWQVVGLSLAEGLWCAVVTVCGTDALATRLEGDERTHGALLSPGEGGPPSGYPVR